MSTTLAIQGVGQTNRLGYSVELLKVYILRGGWQGSHIHTLMQVSYDLITILVAKYPIGYQSRNQSWSNHS